MHVDADLHIHGRYSRAVSPDMTIGNIALNAKVKGLVFMGTGDCLHAGWLREIKALKEVAPGTFEHECGTRFILTTEVEDFNRVHHILILPSIEAAEELRNRISPFAPNLDSDGRPNVRLDGESVANMVTDLGGLAGPAHAFTPWTSLYKSFPSLEACYKGAAGEIRFLELGLSADTYFADKVSELSQVTFLTNSDAHSPAPHRLGREFNRFEVHEPVFSELVKAIKREDGRKVVMNVGFDPREGKYHCTACSRCFQKYVFDEAKMYDFVCVKCGGRIKMGVRDRIERMADQLSTSPPHRPPYVHIFPLAEIIQKALGFASPTVKGVQDTWQKLVEGFGSEIAVLVDAPPRKIGEINAEVASAIKKFRDGEVIVVPGGGGRYGELIVPKNAAELKKIVKERANELNCVSGINQKTLDRFF